MNNSNNLFPKLIMYSNLTESILCKIEVCKYNIKHECYYKDNVLVNGDCEHKPTIIKV